MAAHPDSPLFLPEFAGDPLRARRLLVRVRCPAGAAPPPPGSYLLDACSFPAGDGDELWILCRGDAAGWEGVLCRLAAWAAGMGGEVSEARLLAGEAERIADLRHPAADDLARRFGLCLAGAAFGSGQHPSTRLAAAALEEIAVLGPLGRVCDVGCGSGILAMIAVRLGAARVVALDIEEEAVAAARENLRRNRGMEGVVLLAGGVAAVRATFDLVVANLPAAVLLRSLPEIAGRLAPEGRLLLAGFLEGQAALLDERAGRLGLHLWRSWDQGAWGCRLYRRGGPPA